MSGSSDAHRAGRSSATDHQSIKSATSPQERNASREREGTTEVEKVESKEPSSADETLVPSPEVLKGDQDSDDATGARSNKASVEEVEAVVDSALNDHKTLNHQGGSSASAPSEGIVSSVSPASSEPVENFEGSDDPIVSIGPDLSLSGSEQIEPFATDHEVIPLTRGVT